MTDPDLSQKLDQVLSDPARLAQIAALAKSFAAPEQERAPETSLGKEGCGEADKSASILSFLPREFLLDWKEHAKDRIALLKAVRPFLEPERRGKVDRILTLLKTLELLTALQA